MFVGPERAGKSALFNSVCEAWERVDIVSSSTPSSSSQSSEGFAVQTRAMPLKKKGRVTVTLWDFPGNELSV